MNGKVLVVGGGIAGLAVAQGLLAGGWEVDVRERLAGPPDIGGALGMWPNAMAALDRLGLGGRVRARAEQRSGACLLRPDGTVLLRAGSRASAHLVSRSALLDVLHEGLPGGLVRWNTPVNADDLVRGERYDLVVGADGLNSLVRRTAFPRARPPRRLGSVAYRGALPGRVGKVTETWGKGRLFGITPLDARTTNWFAALGQNRLSGTGDEDHVAVLRREFGAWHPEVARVLAGLETHGADRRVLYDVPGFGPYTRGRHVLIGDAAHAMAPNLGRGACEALVDAVALADSLNEEPALARALARYDRARRGPTRRFVAASRALNRIATTSRGAPARDHALNALSRLT